MSTQADPLLVGGSQQVLLQGQQLANAANCTLLPYFRSRPSRPSSAHDLQNKRARDGFYRAKLAQGRRLGEVHVPSRGKRHTFLFPQLCFSLLE